MNSIPFDNSAIVALLCFILQLFFSLSFIILVIYVTLYKIKVKIDTAVKVTLIIFSITSVIRASIWILIESEIEENTSGQVLSLMVAIGGHMIITSLYYFTLEMEACKIMI